MAFVQVSASVQTSGASSLSPTLNGVTAGNSLIYAIAFWRASAPTSTAPTDYNEHIESAASDNGKIAQGSRENAPSGTNTPSIGLGSSSWARAYLLEYSGIGAPAGAVNSATGSGTSASSGAVTPAASTSQQVACMSHTSGTNLALTPGGAWQQRAETEDVGSGQPINVADLTGVTGSQTATWTWSGTASWSGCVVSYPVAAAAPVLPPRQVPQYQAAHRAATI